MRDKILICTNRRLHPETPSCAARGSEALRDQLQSRIQQQGLAIEIEEVRCLGECEKGPNLRVAPAGRFFSQFSAEDIPELLDYLRSRQDQPHPTPHNKDN